MCTCNSAAITLVLALLTCNAGAQTTPGKLYGEASIGYESYDGFYDKQGDPGQSLFLRRLKAGWKWTPSTNWSTEVELKYAYIDESEWEAGDVKLMYSPQSALKFTLGYFKLPFGMERNTGFGNISTVERSLETDSFTLGRHPGVSLLLRDSDWQMEAGVFQTVDNEDAPDTIAIRSSYCLLGCKYSGLHLGFSAQATDWQANPFQIRLRPELETADTILRSARFRAEKSQSYAVELLGFHNNVQFTAELFSQHVEQINTEEWHYWGGYAQLAIGLSGERYRYKSGKIKVPKSKPGSANWEWVARVGKLDIRDHAIGSLDQHWLTGINGYFPHGIRVSINYLYHHANGDYKGVYDHGHALNSRLQFTL